jgi:phosphoesterase RecJ-like protein
MVWQFARTLGTPSGDVAECCYVGLVTDTGRFSYDNTSAEALRDAAEMVDAGVSPAHIAHQVYQSRTSASLAIESRALSRLTLANDGHVAYAWVSDADFAELDVLPEEAENLPDAIRVIGGIDAAVFLRQHATEVRANLRSKTGADVSKVAAHFGGGGHRAASGFTFEGDIETLMPLLLPLLPGGDQA